MTQTIDTPQLLSLAARRELLYLRLVGLQDSLAETYNMESTEQGAMVAAIGVNRVRHLTVCLLDHCAK